MLVIRNLVIPSLLILAIPARAEKPSPDFSKGLEALAQLGLPDMKGATWIKRANQSNSGEAFTDSYYFQEMDVKISGNTWKLTAEKPSYLDFGSPVIMHGSAHKDEAETRPSNEKPSIFKKMLLNHQKENPEPEPEPEKKKEKPPIPASLAADDAKKIAKAISKADVAEELENAMKYGSSELPGRLLLFAAQLHASGDTESANLIANSLFSAITDDQGIIDKAISQLAEIEYSKIANNFFSSYDWKTYETEIRKLLEKYPRGWHSAQAVAILLSKLEQRSSTPPTPSLPDITIKPEAIALLDKLLEKSDQNGSDEELAKASGYDLDDYTPQQRAQIIAMLRSGRYGRSHDTSSIWLLTKIDSAEATPIDKLKAMRMDGLIALAAVAQDDTLATQPNSSSSSYYYNSSNSPAEDIRLRYNNLNRPATRGEIATALLTSVVPTQSDSDPYSGSAPDPSEIQSAAIEFWKKNKTKTKVELALIYMKEGSANQKLQAANMLAASKKPATLSAFETAILNSDFPIEYITTVDQYLTKRKAAAKPFADAYIKLLQDNPPNENELNRSSAGWQIREAGGLEKYLKKLSVSVGDVSLSKLISTALRETPEEGQPSPILALATTIQSIPLSECVTEFGKIIPKLTPQQSSEIHALLLRRIYAENQNSDGDAEKKPSAPAAEIIQLWKPLIANTAPLDASGEIANFARPYGATTFGEASAIIFEISNDPPLVYALNSFAQLEGDSKAVIKFIKQRTDAYINGTTPPLWPALENVSEERYEELSKKLAELPANEIISFAKALEPSERLAIMDMVENYDDDNPAPAGLLDLKNTIVSLTPISTYGHDADATASLELAVGQKLNADLISKVAENLLKNADKSSTTNITFYPGAIYLGTTIHVSTLKDLDISKIQTSDLSYLPHMFEEYPDHKAIVVVNSEEITDFLGLEKGKLVSINSEERGIENFTKALEQKSAIIPYLSISILSAKDAAKINKLEEE